MPTAQREALIFLSTPSARRATSRFLRGWQSRCISIHALREEGDADEQYRIPKSSNFYPRPPRGGRRGGSQQHNESSSISIHALREEGDRNREKERLEHIEFLSTPSARRATEGLQDGVGKPLDFYPRPPRGGRPMYIKTGLERLDISIHALREEGDILQAAGFEAQFKISIHALREEGDPGFSGRLHRCRKFLSTPSARRATNCTTSPTL